MVAAVAPSIPKAQLVKFNLKNKVRQTPLGRDQALRPVYEAVANAFDAIHECNATEGKSVTVRLVRSHRPDDGSLDGMKQHPVVGFEIEDNGVGFTDDNFESFEEAYSGRKQSTGGKGSGRFLWLKAFASVRLTSTYLDRGGQPRRRSFRFDLERGVVATPDDTAPAASTGTTVRLEGLLDDYRCPQSAEAIARHLVEHTLEQMLASERIKFVLEDEESRPMNLRQLFKKEFRAEQKRAQVTVDGRTFHIRHFLVKAGCFSGHKINLCSRFRSIESVSPSRFIGDLKEPLSHADGEPVYYLGTVTGDYLDQMVDDTRTAFLIPTEPNFTDLTKDQIGNAIAKKVREFLAGPLAELAAEKEKKVQRVVAEQAPELRTVVGRHPELLERINIDASDNEILTTIAGQRYADREDYRRLEEALLRSTKAADKMTAYKKDLVERFASETQSQAAIALAEFVCHRRAVLNVLNDLFGTDEDTDQAYREEAVHQLLFPMRKTTDDVPPDLSNLWVIDERLAFHHYLASDKRFDKLDAVSVDSTEEPDIIVFHHAYATADEPDCPQAITIIEFKRPSRTQYDFEENPFQQVLRYVSRIQEGKETDRRGRSVEASDGTRFFCYIIADFKPALVKLLKFHGFNNGPEPGIMFKNESSQVYIEALSYQKVLKDAKRRNRPFFLKLGMSPVW